MNTAPNRSLNENQLPPENTNTSECAYAWLCVLIGYLFCRAFPASQYPLGMFIVFLIANAVSSIMLVKNGTKFGFKWICSMAVSLITSAAPMFTAEYFAVFFSFCISIFAYCYFIYAATDNCLEKGFSNFIIFDFINAVLLFPMHSFGKIFPALFSGKKRSFRLVLKIVLGVLAGIIPTAVVVSLLAYDDKFSAIMESVLEFFEDFNLFSHIGSLFLGVIIAILLFGLYYSSVEHTEDKIKAENCRNKLQHIRVIPCVTVCAALLPLVAVYVIFFVSQWEYYVSAFTGVLPHGLIYSSYAREGFFQLCQVSGINLGLLIALSLFSRRDGKYNHIFLKTVKILFSVITLVLIATAISKMVLYIHTYGLTEKRLLSSWLMIVIALVFLLIIIKQFVSKLKVIAASLCVALIMFAGLALSNYGAIIADYNVDKYISGDLKNVDVYLLSELGESAVPAMVRLAEYYQTTYGYEDDPTYPSRPSGDNKIHYYKLTVELENYRDINMNNDSIFAFSIPRLRAEKSIDKFFN